MSGSVSMPEPTGGDRRTVSLSMWEPEAAEFDPHVVSVLQEQISGVLHVLDGIRVDLVAQGSGLGVVSEDVDLPPTWADSPGSPLYYVDGAASFLVAAMSGNVCRAQHPPAPKSHQPPPGDRWCCGHEPEQHC